MLEMKIQIGGISLKDRGEVLPSIQKRGDCFCGGCDSWPAQYWKVHSLPLAREREEKCTDAMQLLSADISAGLDTGTSISLLSPATL